MYMKEEDLIIVIGFLLLFCLWADGGNKAYAAKKAAKGGGAKFTLKAKTKVLKAPKVQLVFWGPWGAGSPTTAQIDAQFRALMASNFYAKLAQYGGGKPTYLGSINSAAAAPSGFKDPQITSAIGALITAKKVPDMRTTPDIIYILLPPKGVKAADKVGDAYHQNFNWGGAVANFVVYYGKSDLVSLMRALSEEIAESITDPWQTSNGDQIGDPCENTFQVNGVTVEGYWSNSEGGCTTS